MNNRVQTSYSFWIKNRFKFYNNFVVIVADSLVAKLCVELLYIEKAIVLTEIFTARFRSIGDVVSREMESPAVSFAEKVNRKGTADPEFAGKWLYR